MAAIHHKLPSEWACNLYGKNVLALNGYKYTHLWASLDISHCHTTKPTNTVHANYNILHILSYCFSLAHFLHCCFSILDGERHVMRHGVQCKCSVHKEKKNRPLANWIRKRWRKYAYNKSSWSVVVCCCCRCDKVYLFIFSASLETQNDFPLVVI